LEAAAAKEVENTACLIQAQRMVNRRPLGFWLLTCLLGAGCEKPAGTTGPGPAAPAENGLPTQAQGPLPTTRLWLATEELTTELALTGEQQWRGMMFRTNLAENAGMLFVFPVPHRASFWMKNTPLPLSAAYIGADGTILELHDLHPGRTNSVEASSDRVQFVLEVNQGWFQRHGISTGVLVRAESGPLGQIGKR
jgi:uncharacterized membrane protein (UPF0127 family)